MADVYKTPEKTSLKRRLFEIGLETLRSEGYKVERIPGFGKASVRRITKGADQKVVSIRTTQDRHIAFPRLPDDSGWRTLDDVDMVVAVSVDDAESPKNAWVHFLDGSDMRDRFNRTYKARLAADRTIPLGRGVWLSLYHPESKDRPDHVGAGAGLQNPKVGVVPLLNQAGGSDTKDTEDFGLTIAEAKRRLASSLGVNESSIKITVEA
jgi:hypothetical protein